MNIMQKLGFTRRQEGKTENVKANEEAKNFTIKDTLERREGESRIYNLIILDESGSMSSIYDQALSGVNETIRTIRQAQQDSPELTQMFTFVTFDLSAGRKDVRAVIGCEPVAKVQDITPDQYRPRGSTPLYDAMGISISALRDVVKDGDNVLVTVITDGLENSSRIWSSFGVRDLVEGLRAQGWVFTYIGANQDSADVAGGLGIRMAMDFYQDDRGTKMMWDKMNSSRRAYYKKVSRYQQGECVDLEDDFFSQGQISSRITPEHIVELGDNEIFVFGSNLQGQHAGGAAAQAVSCFGAVWGQGVGLQGRSYAIPTMQGGVETIRPYVEEFFVFADRHPEMRFLVTRIGCGIAGFTDHDIAPLFAGALGLPNVCLPESFWKEIDYRYR